jgi:hypothetical protein
VDGDKTDLSAQEAPTRSRARFLQPHEHPGRSECVEGASRQGPEAPECVGSILGKCRRPIRSGVLIEAPVSVERQGEIPAGTATRRELQASTHCIMRTAQRRAVQPLWVFSKPTPRFCGPAQPG